MGGFGSGRWTRWESKASVEICLKLNIREFRGKLRGNSKGKITWTRQNGMMVVEYAIYFDNEVPTLALGYLSDDLEIVIIPVKLQSTETNFGGKRWWFTCPLIKNDEVCGGRVGVLHLPPGAKYFGCRKCYELTYESSQQSHHDRRMLARIDKLGYRGSLKYLKAALL